MNNEKLKVAVLGPLGTYTHEAAFKILGSEALYVEKSSIADVFKALSPTVPLGVIPQENSIFGSVIETYDQLRTTNTAFVRGEITLKVEHCLLVKKGVKLRQITKVISHEQALGQCRNFLAEKLPIVSTIKMQSTAAAAQALLDEAPDCAAICSGICAKLFDGLEILFKNIQNEASNFTRFYIIAYKQHMTLPPILGTDCQMKAIFRIFSTSRDLVACIASMGLSVTRIDRRPSPDGVPFDSVYFIEVHGYSHTQTLVEHSKSWTATVEKASLHVQEELGGTSVVVGIW